MNIEFPTLPFAQSNTSVYAFFLQILGVNTPRGACSVCLVCSTRHHYHPAAKGNTEFYQLDFSPKIGAWDLVQATTDHPANEDDAGDVRWNNH